MLTSRGWWLLLILLAVLGLAMLVPPKQEVPGRQTMAILGLTVLLWFLFEWLLFAIRVRMIVPLLRVRREVWDERGPVETLWAGRNFLVHARVGLPSGILGLPYILLTDFRPFGVEEETGETRYEGSMAAGHDLEIRYSIQCPPPGQVRFEGLKIQVADKQGLFYHVGFLSSVEVYRVLPPLVDVEGHAPDVKRHNLLPPPGIHRLRRPGSGSELLDLRDYIPGDPPRTIAWKVSARRDRLITKEFESEVPVRCTLFVDTSNSVRLGSSGQNALSRLVEIAAGVAQAAAGAHDLTGLCLFDEHAANYIRPARNSGHLIKMLNLLADAAGLTPTTGKASVAGLLPQAYSFAQEVYPHLLRRDMNRAPFWLPWLWPQPAYTLRKPTLADRVYSRLLLVMVVYAVGGFILTAIILLGLLNWAGAPGMDQGMVLPIAGVIGLALVANFFLLPTFMFFPKRRRQFRWRKQLAALLSARYGLAPGGLGLLLEDDEQLSLHLQKFLSEHQVPYTLPLYEGPRYLFAAPEKVDVLAKSLLRAVGKGHDNELFVLLADVLELSDRLDPLLRAVKVALSRHHRVMVICPWPLGMPVPGKPGAKGKAKGKAQGGGGKAKGLEKVLRQATIARYHWAYHQLRRSLARLQVPVVCAASGDPVRLILDRMDQLRTVRRYR